MKMALFQFLIFQFHLRSCDSTQLRALVNLSDSDESHFSSFIQFPQFFSLGFILISSILFNVPVPTIKFSNSPLKEKPAIITLEKKCELADPRPGHGMYKNMKRPISAETPATYAEEEIPDNPPFIIENDDKILSFVPDQVAEKFG